MLHSVSRASTCPPQPGSKAPNAHQALAEEEEEEEEEAVTWRTNSYGLPTPSLHTTCAHTHTLTKHHTPQDGAGRMLLHVCHGCHGQQQYAMVSSSTPQSAAVRHGQQQYAFHNTVPFLPLSPGAPLSLFMSPPLHLSPTTSCPSLAQERTQAIPPCEQQQPAASLTHKLPPFPLYFPLLLLSPSPPPLFHLLSPCLSLSLSLSLSSRLSLCVTHQ